MTAPISPTDFAALMAPLAPFEPAPCVAVAVSGGADSMALALLARDWAAEWGGQAVALSVDHGLRADSAAEARQVGEWLARHGMEHHILRWEGTKPASDIQAQARAARYDLLQAWCRGRGVLHCLLAHHREDQAETVLLRLGRGSGVDGLSAMAPVQPARFGRWLRPLLPVDKARLRATLRARGQDWVEDPSNANTAYARVRLRRLEPALAAEGLTARRLAETAGRLGRAREALDQAVAAAAACYVAVHPAGYAMVQPRTFARLPAEIGLRLTVRLLLAVGGGLYAPRAERSEALHAALCQELDAARTLGGCRVVPLAGGAVLFCRESARMQAPVPLVPGGETAWDGRFLALAEDGAPSGLRLGALGIPGWRQVGRLMAPLRPHGVPAAARPSLPAIYDEDGIFAVPHLGYKRGMDALGTVVRIVAAPSIPLTVAGRRLV